MRAGDDDLDDRDDRALFKLVVEDLIEELIGATHRQAKRGNYYFGSGYTRLTSL
jgi:hypothetical protein